MIHPDVVLRIPLFARLNAGAIRELAARSTLRSFQADEVLWHAGAEPRGFSVITQGAVKVVRTVHGRQHVVHVEGEGGTPGDVALFDVAWNRARGPRERMMNSPLENREIRLRGLWPTLWRGPANHENPDCRFLSRRNDWSAGKITWRLLRNDRFAGWGMQTNDFVGRLFVGVPLTEEARREIGRHVRRWMPDRVPGRPVPAASWHLTLRFLGATSADQLADIVRHLRAAKMGEAFDVGFGGLGAFSRPRSARVLWVGVTDGVERMQGLGRIAEDAARAAGFVPEEKSFKPHLTLSRIQPPRDVTRAIQDVPPLDLRMPVREVVIFRSHLGGGPARYEAVERFALAPSGERTSG